MLYLLDANVLIRAHEDYYPIDRVEPFWKWLVLQAQHGRLKMPFEIHDEIASATRGDLKDWIVQPDVKSCLVLEEEVDAAIFNEVLDSGYGAGLNDTELETIGRDAFLVAYARMAPARAVVTREVSVPSKQRANRKVPDVCSAFGVPWMNDFTLWRTLDFRI